MQNRHRLRQRIAARRRLDSEWVEAVQRSCCCTKDPTEEENAMSVLAEATLISSTNKPIREKTLTASDAGRTFDFADFESQYAQADDSSGVLRNLYSVCFPRPALCSSTIEIALVGIDGFKKERLGSVKCSLAEIFWNHDEVQAQRSGEPKQIADDNKVAKLDSNEKAWMGNTEQSKRLSLSYEFVSKGTHIAQFAGSVKCRFSLTETEIIVDFIEARELRDLK